MNTKLTLSLNKNISENAKLYAKKNNTSLSKLIENYLNSITKSLPQSKKISPLVESLTGVITDGNIELKKNQKKERFPSMNEPVHLGFDFQKISREEINAR